jgi:hypothetical protein
MSILQGTGLMTGPPNSAAKCNFSAERIERWASGEWQQIHTDTTQIPADLLEGGDHPCPLCGGTDRFNVSRDSYHETGQVFCKTGCPLHGQSGIGVVKAANKITFPEACAKVGDWLLEKGLCNQADLVDDPRGARCNGTNSEGKTPSSPSPQLLGFPAGSQAGQGSVLPKPKMKDGRPCPMVHERLTDCVSGALWYQHQRKKILSSVRPPDQHFVYESSPGNVAFIVLRWNLTEEERERSGKTKVIAQIARVEGGWQSGNPYRDRPLYGLFHQPRTLKDVDESTDSKDRHPDLPDVSSADVVFVCEGETSAEALCDIGLVAVCPSQGANSPQLTDFRPLNGKNLVLCPDHDSDGEQFIQIVRGILSAQAPESPIEVRCFADDPEFGSSISEGDDAVDWLAFHNGKATEDLRAIFDQLPDRSEEERFAPRALNRKKGEGPAKEEKTARLENYEMVPAGDGESDDSESAEPLSLQLIFDELHKKAGDWPRSVNGVLFVLKHDGQPRYLKDRNDLFAWIGEQFDAPADFRGGLHSRDEFFAHVKEHSICYDTIEHAPHYPEWKTSYYCHDPLPDNADGSFIRQFLDFFNPETEADRALLYAFVLTLAWGGPPGKRPAFVLEADGPGSGKSVLAHRVASLFGGYISVPKNLRDFDKLVSRVLTPSSFSKRMLLMDNVKAIKLSTADLESLITEPIISGHRLYCGEGTRPNNLTVVITANSPQLGTDLSERSIVIKIRRSTYSATWDEDVTRFVEEKKVEIWSDVIALLESPTAQIAPVSRFGPWENEVLAKVPGYESAQRILLPRQKEINADFEALNAFEDYIICRLEELKYRTGPSDSPDAEEESHCVFISNERMAKWYSDFSSTRASSENIKQKLTVLRQKRVNCLIHDKRLNACRGFIFGPWRNGDNYEADLEERISYDERRRREAFS